MDPETNFERHRRATRERLRASGLARPGSASVSWRVNREILVVAGWGRAILMQLAHPLVAAGIDGHTRFRASLGSGIRRLKSTVGAMLALSFGSDEQAIAAAAGINVIHDRVNGMLTEPAGAFPAGEKYSAHQAELLRWVHATLVDSIPRTYELLVGPVGEGSRDQYCAEALVMEPLLDIPAGLLPRSADALDRYMRDVLEGRTIAITDSSRRLARAVLFPPGWRMLWPAFRPVQLITIGLLPPALRDAYGFAWTPREARALGRWVRAIRALRQVTPSFAREWPASRRQRRPNDVGRNVMELSAGALLLQLIKRRLSGRDASAPAAGTSTPKAEAKSKA